MLKRKGNFLILKLKSIQRKSSNLSDNTPLALHCIKGVHILSYPGQDFPAFGLNTEYLFIFSPNARKSGSK